MKDESKGKAEPWYPGYPKHRKKEQRKL